MMHEEVQSDEVEPSAKVHYEQSKEKAVGDSGEIWCDVTHEHGPEMDVEYVPEVDAWVPPPSDDDEEGGPEVVFCVPPPSDVEYVIRQFCDPPPSDNEDDSYAETGEEPPAYYPPPDMTYHIKWM